MNPKLLFIFLAFVMLKVDAQDINEKKDSGQLINLKQPNPAINLELKNKDIAECRAKVNVLNDKQKRLLLLNQQLLEIDQNIVNIDDKFGRSNGSHNDSLNGQIGEVNKLKLKVKMLENADSDC